MEDLDLNFASHYGEFVKQRMAGREELAGHDVSKSIDIIDDVKCWVRDLEEAWEKENDRQRNEVTPRQGGKRIRSMPIPRGGLAR